MKTMTIVGRITRDAELTMVNGNVPVCNFNVAVNNRKATAEVKDGKRVYAEMDPDFFKVTLWRNQAQALAKYLTKGRQVLVSGDFALETWMRTTGAKKGQVEATAHFTSPQIELLGAQSAKVEEPKADAQQTAPETDIPAEDALDVDEQPFV